MWRYCRFSQTRFLFAGNYTILAWPYTMKTKFTRTRINHHSNGGCWLFCGRKIVNTPPPTLLDTGQKLWQYQEFTTLLLHKFQIKQKLKRQCVSSTWYKHKTSESNAYMIQSPLSHTCLVSCTESEWSWVIIELLCCQVLGATTAYNASQHFHSPHFGTLCEPILPNLWLLE